MASRKEIFDIFRKSVKQNREVTLPVVRPPYGKDESFFQSECIVCMSKACVTSCEEKIIVLKEDGTPTLSFLQSGCMFCEACAMSCDADVLSLENQHTAEHIHANFRISTQDCVAHHGVICFSCKEPCIDDAILFNGMFNPVIDMQKCTGCGFCMGRCPAQAIEFTPTTLKEGSK